MHVAGEQRRDAILHVTYLTMHRHGILPVATRRHLGMSPVHRRVRGGLVAKWCSV
jgi:hypothetical protein